MWREFIQTGFASIATTVSLFGDRVSELAEQFVREDNSGEILRPVKINQAGFGDPQGPRKATIGCPYVERERESLTGTRKKVVRPRSQTQKRWLPC